MTPDPPFLPPRETVPRGWVMALPVAHSHKRKRSRSPGPAVYPGVGYFDSPHARYTEQPAPARESRHGLATPWAVDALPGSALTGGRFSEAGWSHRPRRRRRKRSSDHALRSVSRTLSQSPTLRLA